MDSFFEGARQTIKEEYYEKGLNQGIIENAANNVFNCMNSFNVSLKQALDSLKIREDIKDAVIKKIEEIKNKKD